VTKGWVNEELKVFRQGCHTNFLNKKSYESDKKKSVTKIESLLEWQIDAKEDANELWKYIEKYREELDCKAHIQ
jgi:hypothetical protein